MLIELELTRETKDFLWGLLQPTEEQLRELNQNIKNLTKAVEHIDLS